MEWFDWFSLVQTRAVSLALVLSIELWIGHRLEDWQMIDIWLVMEGRLVWGIANLDWHRIQMGWRLIEFNYESVIFSHFFL